MRDKRMNAKYFEDYISYQKSRIEKKASKLNDSKDNFEKAQRILISLVGYEVDLLKAEFSNGASEACMRALLSEAVEYISLYNNPTQEAMVVVLSLSVLLDCKENANKLVRTHEKMISGNRFLSCLSTYLHANEFVWDEDLPIGNEFSALSKSINADTLKKYLNEWYDNHTEYAWYNSHLKDTETYCGYWCFEAAALAKIIGVNPDQLAANEYFPHF